jgi:hypothetical protein
MAATHTDASRVGSPEAFDQRQTMWTWTETKRFSKTSEFYV